MMMKALRPLLAVMCLVLAPLPLLGEGGADRELDEVVETAPVVIDGRTLFRLRGTTARPAGARAAAIAGRIEALAADRNFSPDSIRAVHEPGGTMLMARNGLIMAVTDADARLMGIDQRILAITFQNRMREAIAAWRRDRAPQTLRRNALYAIVATLLFVIVMWSGFRLMRRLRRTLEARVRERVRDVQLREFRVVEARQLWRFVTGVVFALSILAALAAIHIYLSTVLALFPWTRGFANELVSIVVNPLRTLGLGFLAVLPDLVFLAIIFVITRYLLKLVYLYFDNLADGRATLPGFDPEWAIPTYRLVRILLVAFMIIVAYPYIPGSGSEAFKGVSLFIGVLFSLGSTSVIGNVIAGYTMTYRRVFKVGDRVKVREFVGNVESIKLLVTYLRTLKNELVAIPNSVILSTEVINYSAQAETRGLILHTTVGIGYETPWRQVEGILLSAVEQTPGLLKQPPPFVLYKGLGDFAVAYEVNAYCAEPQLMNQTYADLTRNILDAFNEYGVQIMTPAYEGDTPTPKIVPKDQWYAEPARPPKSELKDAG
jgi:small-conductance mechanosensitive channel